MDSYLPEDLSFSKVVGVGMNEGELKSNPRLTDTLVQNLNKKVCDIYKHAAELVSSALSRWSDVFWTFLFQARSFLGGGGGCPPHMGESLQCLCASRLRFTSAVHRQPSHLQRVKTRDVGRS